MELGSGEVESAIWGDWEGQSLRGHREEVHVRDAGCDATLQKKIEISVPNSMCSWYATLTAVRIAFALFFFESSSSAQSDCSATSMHSMRFSWNKRTLWNSSTHTELVTFSRTSQISIFFPNLPFPANKARRRSQWDGSGASLRGGSWCSERQSTSAKSYF